MARKTQKTVEELYLLFENPVIQEEVRKRKPPIPFVIETHIQEKTTHIYSLVCPECKKTFCFEKEGLISNRESVTCPECGHHLDEKMTLSSTVSEARYIGSWYEYTTMIQEIASDEYLFSVFTYDTNYNAETKEIKQTFVFRFLSYFSNTSDGIEKVSYIRDMDGKWKKTAKKFMTTYSSLLYRYDRNIYLLPDTTKEPAPYCRDVLRTIDSTKMVVPTTRKKVIEKPTDIPMISEIEAIGIKSETVLVDHSSHKKVESHECLACGHAWETESSLYKRELIVCPICKTEKVYFGSQNYLYIREDDGIISAQVVEYSIRSGEIVSDLQRTYMIDTLKMKREICDFSEYLPVHRNKPVDCYVNKIVILCSDFLSRTGIYQLRDTVNSPNERHIMQFLIDGMTCPVLEKIAKAGFINEYFETQYSYDAYDFNHGADSIYEAFGIGKPFLRAFKKKEFSPNKIFMLHDLVKAFPDINPDDAMWCIKHNINAIKLKNIIDIVPHLTPANIVSYLEKVRLSQMCEPCTAEMQWRDYLRAATSIEMDMHDRKALYPRALKTEHDIVVAKQRFATDKTTKEAFLKAVEDYKHLEYHKDDYFIRVPANTEEMLEEGRKLNHCCGRYIDDVAEKSAFVLFLRKKAEPEIPFLSMEVLPDGTIRQVRGKNDCLYSIYPEYREITEFLESFSKRKHLTMKLI